MKFAISLLFLIGLTACQTAQGTNSGFELSNEAGPEFSITGTSSVSSDQLKKEMTFKAAEEAQRRGYPIVALISNSPVRTENGSYAMTASYRGFSSFAEVGNRQALVANSYIEASQRRAPRPSKYGGGLFYPTTAQGRAVDAAIKSIFRGY